MKKDLGTRPFERMVVLGESHAWQYQCIRVFLATGVLLTQTTRIFKPQPRCPVR